MFGGLKTAMANAHQPQLQQPLQHSSQAFQRPRQHHPPVEWQPSLQPHTNANEQPSMMDDDDAATRSSPQPQSSPPPSSTTTTTTTRSPGSVSDLRIQKDLQELSLSKFTANAATRITFPDGINNLRRFQVLVTPSTGLYAFSSFLFSVFIPTQYPFVAPKVKSHTHCLHPNINWRTGAVYLHLLKSEWKPVLSINAVIFSLQLLFLEPWPVSSSTVSATSLTMPPSRPMLTASLSGSAVSSASTAPPQSALTLASSKSATASAARQFDEGSILNLEIYQLILSGDRSAFEDLVRRTLEGGFFYGEHWPRNKVEPESDDEDEHQLMDEEKSSEPFDALLQKVDENGRKAHINPLQFRNVRPVADETLMEMDSDEEETSSTAASSKIVPHSPNRTIGSRSTRFQSLSGVPVSKPTPTSPATKALHRKRSFHKTSPSRAHTYNPAACLTTTSNKYSPTPSEDEPSNDYHLQKRSRALPLEEILESTSPSRTTNGRILHMRQSPSTQASTTTTQPSTHLLSVPTGDSRPNSRKRPSPGSSSAFSDGEYDDEDESKDSSLESKDDGSTFIPSRRRKKYKQDTSRSIDDLDEDEEMRLLDDAALLPSLYDQPTSRTPPTTLPDLTTFASFRPEDSVEEIVRRSCTPKETPNLYSQSSTSSSQSAAGQSPKRNVSDYSRVNFVPAMTAGDMSDSIFSSTSPDSAESSFILQGRSSSRSLNLFGDIKSQVVHPVQGFAGLADLQGILNSLPRTTSNQMME